jgi:hypothetical protein
MKISKTALYGLLAISAIGIVVYVTRKHKKRIKLTHIADEGYEIAHDILYPNQLHNEKNLRYGPVLPE